MSKRHSNASMSVFRVFVHHHRARRSLERMRYDLPALCVHARGVPYSPTMAVRSP